MKLSANPIPCSITSCLNLCVTLSSPLFSRPPIFRSFSTVLEQSCKVIYKSAGQRRAKRSVCRKVWSRSSVQGLELFRPVTHSCRPLVPLTGTLAHLASRKRVRPGDVSIRSAAVQAVPSSLCEALSSCHHQRLESFSPVPVVFDSFPGSHLQAQRGGRGLLRAADRPKGVRFRTSHRDISLGTMSCEQNPPGECSCFKKAHSRCD